MKVSAQIRVSPGAASGDRPVRRIVDYARRIEAAESRGSGSGIRSVAADPASIRSPPESTSLAQAAQVSLICPPDEARRRLKRVEALSFDEILLISQTNSLEEVERARDFL